MREEFSLSIPGRAQYVGVARLAVAGFAGEQHVSLDELEDIKLAVAEACGEVLSSVSAPVNLLIECHLDDHLLDLAVRSVVLPPDTAVMIDPTLEVPPSLASHAGSDVGMFLLEALMDEVSLEAEGDCRLVRMQKRLGVERDD